MRIMPHTGKKEYAWQVKRLICCVLTETEFEENLT
jgi:hypothetical protein